MGLPGAAPGAVVTPRLVAADRLARSAGPADAPGNSSQQRSHPTDRKKLPHDEDPFLRCSTRVVVASMVIIHIFRN